MFLAAAFSLAMAITPIQADSASRPVTAPTSAVRTTELTADYFQAETATARRGAVVVLGGSEGALSGSRGLARRLAADGFDAIAVSYFGEPGQPAKLDRIPIEFVQSAVTWLQARAQDSDEPIAVVGVSKGAELALVWASLDPRIAAVAAGTPSSVVWQGIDQTGGETGASWTLGGKPLAYAPYDMSNGFQGIHRLYSDSLKSAPPEAAIAVERIAGPILFVSSRDDGLWPATPMVESMQARLEDVGFAHPVEHLVYDQAGHGVFGPPIAEITPANRMQMGFLGGTEDGLRSARADVWPRVLAFLERSLAD